jgi:hypothetical protein
VAEEIAASVEDYLVGLASSLQQAQRQLSELTVLGDADRPSITYQLPKLDFELRLALEVSTQESGGSGGGLALRGRLVNPSGSRSSSSESASVIRGSFVAVPTSGGRPPPLLTTELRPLPDDELQLGVVARLATATGEPIEGEIVQFNVDRSLSARLNPRVADPPTRGPVHAVLRTDASGSVENLIDGTGHDEPVKIPVTIDAMGRTTTVVFAVEADGRSTGGGD